MPTKKKTSPATEPVVKATAAAPEKKKTTRTKSPAATHKNPARKSAAPKAAKAAAPGAKVTTAAKAAFDAALHHDEIAREAYFLYINRGGHPGHEHEDWLSAVEIVRARY
ncbi:MAG: DUF2934 domain-containing protein [Acidobacteria bacterium]|nr:DUF2934 domain-containing protein [Acidobacteriota bacterium]